MNKVKLKPWLGFLFLAVAMGLLLFVPTRIIDYWQAWLFLAVLFHGIAVRFAVPDETTPGAAAASHEGRTHGRKAKGAKANNAGCESRLHRPACCARP